MYVEYEEFLPLYPEVEDPQLQQKLFNKHEFQQLRLTRDLEPLSGDPGVLAQHQRITQRFLSPHTLYDELLVCHETGTGKSRVAFAISEALLQSGTFDRVYVLTSNKPIQDNLRQELALYSPRFTAPESDLRGILPPRANKWYQWYTFYEFAKQLTPLSAEQLHERYARSVFIVDEVHRLIKGDETSRERTTQRDLEQVYEQLHRLFHACTNRKIVLLSATPMRDRVYELAQVMNLILPANEQLPVRTAFETRFVNKADARLLHVDELKQAFRGRVSYVVAPQSTVQREYQGTPAAGFVPVEAFKVFTTEMHTHQAHGYTRAFPVDVSTEDEDAPSRQSFYSKAREAALFVFPDGSVGKEGEQRYMRTHGRTKELVPELKEEVDTLDKLRRFSSKYAYVIDDVLQHPERNTFIYCHYVNGSGLKLLAKLLELYGFKEATGSPAEARTKARRYVCFTGTPSKGHAEDAAADARRQKWHIALKNFFNHERNANGEYCQVVLGSDIASVSFSFKNIQTIHITTLHWNYTETHQVIGRGLRLGSHDALLQRQANVAVRIFQHVSLPQDDHPAVDLLMFRIAQTKDILIRRMFRVLKETAFDCPLTHERNQIVEATDGARECDYDVCEYACDASALHATTDEWDTYRLYFAEDTEREIQSAVYRLFVQRSPFAAPIHLTTLVDLLGVDDILLLRVLARMIRTHLPIVNAHGARCFLRESADRYYLVDNVAVQGDSAEMGLYTRPPFLTHTQSLSAALERRRLDQDVHWIKQFGESKTDEDVRDVLAHLSHARQQQCVEWALVHAVQHPRTQTLLRLLSDHLRANERGYRFVSTLTGTERGLTAEGTWEDVPQPAPDDTQVMVDPTGAVHTVYGLLSKGKFKIVDRRGAVNLAEGKIDRRKINTGLDCNSYQRPNLAALCVYLDLPAVPMADVAAALQQLPPKIREKFHEIFRTEGLTDPESMAKGLYWMDARKGKNEVCQQLREWFAARGLLFGA
jgi:hypothetical protein